ncbi:MAG: hypothetical protein OJF50_000953 [Nitrospira sp.]|nr:hypothetical protein [Nitrospira sp.]
MSGKAGQRSTKATQLPKRYAQNYLNEVDRRCRAARNQRDLFHALAEECGGVEGLELTELETIRRLAHLCRRIGRMEEADVLGERVEQGALNDSTRSWLGLLRHFLVIKARRRVGTLDPMAALFGEESET